MDWITCTTCEEEFRVLGTIDEPRYCPYCGTELELDFDELDDE